MRLRLGDSREDASSQEAPGTPALRWLQVGLLVLFAAFELAAFVGSRDQRSTLTRVLSPFDRLAYWHFFTKTRTEQIGYRFDGLERSEWRELPMELWFPARWESGYRWYGMGWSRDVAIAPPAKPRRAQIEQAFLEAACRRAGAKATRLVKLTSSKRLGSLRPVSEASTAYVVATRKCHR